MVPCKAERTTRPYRRPLKENLVQRRYTGLGLVSLLCGVVLGLLAQSFRLATPIALGALAGLLCERCGVANIGIEGMMLTAACLGFIVALYTSNTWIGLL